VISELFAEEFCREGLLSPIFCDYLEAARASSPAPPITMERFVAMCTAATASAQVFLEAMPMYPFCYRRFALLLRFRHGQRQLENRRRLPGHDAPFAVA